MVDLVKKKYRIQFFLGLFVNMLTQITGINMYILYSNEIYTLEGIEDPSSMTILLGVTLCSGFIFNIIYGNKLGKRKST